MVFQTTFGAPIEAPGRQVLSNPVRGTPSPFPLVGSSAPLPGLCSGVACGIEIRRRPSSADVSSEGRCAGGEGARRRRAAGAPAGGRGGLVRPAGDRAGGGGCDGNPARAGRSAPVLDR